MIVLVVAADGAPRVRRRARTSSATTRAGRCCREPALPDELDVRRGAPAARAHPGAGRQVDLAPRAAVRGDRRRAQHAHAPRDRRRRRARRSAALDAARREGPHRRRRGTIVFGARRRRTARSRTTCIDCGNSGTTMRVLSGLLAGRPFLSVLTGDASLRERPMATRRRTAARDGCARRRPRRRRRARRSSIRGGASARHAPRARGRARAGEVRAAARRASRPTATTEIVSPAPTRDHTERMLGALGCAGRRSTGSSVRVQRGAPDAVRARRSRRSVVGRVLRRRGVDHARLGDRRSRTSRSTRRGSGSSTCCAAWAPTSTS